MPVLSKEKIWERIVSVKKNRLVIVPIIDDYQVGFGTVDLRLGTSFIIIQNRRIDTLDPTKNFQEAISKYQERVVYPIGSRFILQPGQFVLGGTLEYLKIPYDLLGYVVGRSSWGRLGLVIETSPIVQPCFMGVLTFELSNLGTSPITILPGSRIAQISLHTCDADKLLDCKKVTSKSRYNLSIYPEFSKIYKDNDLNKIKKIFSIERDENKAPT